MIDLHDVLARLYRSEINVSITTFWDAGWDVKLGDEMNGFKAETTIDCPYDDVTKLRTVEDVRAGLVSAALWLDEQAREHYPASDYAKSPLRPSLAHVLADAIREAHLAEGRTVTDEECLGLLEGGSQADFVRLTKATAATDDALAEVASLHLRSAQMAAGMSEYEANEDAWPDEESRARHNRVAEALAAREAATPA